MSDRLCDHCGEPISSIDDLVIKVDGDDVFCSISCRVRFESARSNSSQH